MRGSTEILPAATPRIDATDRTGQQGFRLAGPEVSPTVLLMPPAGRRMAYNVAGAGSFLPGQSAIT